ncbi:pseudouridine synthase [Paraglaciecola aquimarina]|uniref:Pseudouridine synthase n=1 Tax=Paraglaciecola algarum TaxID=3050085 RepID=A0ABS9D587_9ALTE|nr:RluA family pseudouridine synthase [Paraglaciecola sp. G1-23]MCF2946974.1 pseudouridine synthase [Paraglaciecola sp. G1-23]
MPVDTSCFTRFINLPKNYSLPERFTFPFYYQPHALCVLAAEQLQQVLEEQKDWQHNFGLGDDPNNIIGKMFGVLLVKNEQQEIGFISAFSGKLAEQNHLQGFVPPVFDLLSEDSFFLTEQVSINQLNSQIKKLESTAQRQSLIHQLAQIKEQGGKKESNLRAELIENRKLRKQKRKASQAELTADQYQVLLNTLAEQSVYDKWRLNQLIENWQSKATKLQAELDVLEHELKEIKQTRKNASSQLQESIFKQYVFLNRALEPKSLLDIFAETSVKTPPAGAGECAAPKLLQYAFVNQLTPLAIAEFWWGASPKSEVKKHKQFYPACIGKCQPILQHMLQGMKIEPNPFLQNKGAKLAIEIVYEDEDILVINKPSGLLSVPGKHVSDSVLQRIKLLYPKASGPLIVHRLDMATSGLMVLGLTAQANKILQKQFINREVEKQYVAMLDGVLEQEQGVIELPLTGDFYDRPKQLVCFNEGKPAKTIWQVIDRDLTNQQTKILLTPHTGRTHQLRVHCAHAQGLNMPIVGDDLYGKVSSRLLLHAQYLKICHPVSKQFMAFNADASF